MNLFWAAFEGVAALLLLGVLGFWLISRRILPGNTLRSLYPLALEVALPALIFSKIILQFDPVDNPDWWHLPLWWLGFTIAAALLTILCLPLSAKGTRREFGLSLFFQNATFFPIIIISTFFGDGSRHLVNLFFFNLFFSPFFFSSFHFFLGEKGRTGMQWQKIVNPVFAATTLALFFTLSGTAPWLPDFLLSSLQLLGAMAAPLLLLILGGNLYLDFQQKGKIYAVEIVKFVALKNFAFPLLALGILLLIRPTADIAFLILIQSAVPPITSVPLMVERQGGDRAIVNQFLLGSFLASLLALPLMLGILGQFFEILPP